MLTARPDQAIEHGTTLGRHFVTPSLSIGGRDCGDQMRAFQLGEGIVEPARVDLVLAAQLSEIDIGVFFYLNQEPCRCRFQIDAGAPNNPRYIPPLNVAIGHCNDAADREVIA